MYPKIFDVGSGMLYFGGREIRVLVFSSGNSGTEPMHRPSLGCRSMTDKRRKVYFLVLIIKLVNFFLRPIDFASLCKVIFVLYFFGQKEKKRTFITN